MRPTVYASVDLTSGRVTQIVSAPHAWTLGYDADGMAIWSSDGRKLLLTNTFLPLDGVDEVERSKRLRPCIAVVVDRISNATSCVAFFQATTADLRGASFGDTSDDVILRFEGVPPEQRYHFRGGSWHPLDLAQIDQLVEDKDALLNPPQVLTVQIKQDLNTPPALWATDQNTKQSKGSGIPLRNWQN